MFKENKYTLGDHYWYRTGMFGKYTHFLKKLEIRPTLLGGWGADAGFTD